MGYKNYPTKLNTKDYLEAKEKFIDKYSNIPDVISIYSFGCLSTLGISDLDFLVIVKDSINKDVILPDYKDFNNKHSYILSHNPFIFPESQIKDLLKVFNFKNLKHEYGKIIEEFKNIQDFKDYQLFTLIDICNYFYPRIFLNFLHDDNIDIRLLIQMLSAFEHAVELFTNLTSEPVINLIQDNLIKIEHYKSDFFKNNIDINIKNIRKLLLETAESAVLFVSLIDQFIIDNYWREYCFNGSISGIYKYSGYIFINKYSDYSIIDKMVLLYKGYKGWISILPTSFLYPLIRYEKQDGIISSILKDNLILYSKKFTTFKNIEDKLNNRINILNKHYSFYKEQISISPVHDYYQMLGYTLKNREVKKICKTI